MELWDIYDRNRNKTGKIIKRGERMLEGIPKNEIFSRTTQSGKIDLVSIINEFKTING